MSRQPFTSHTGRAVAIDRANIDTDQIIPKQFLTRIERAGYGEFLFYDWRFDSNGDPIAGFPLNDPLHSGASILIAGENFGCGSSREHAPWSILDHGFRTVIAPSFADIFRNNSLKNGLLPVELDGELVFRMIARLNAEPSHLFKIDLENCTVSDGVGFLAEFHIDEFNRHCLINGLDEIGLTLEHETAISHFERNSSYHRISS